MRSVAVRLIAASHSVIIDTGWYSDRAARRAIRWHPSFACSSIGGMRTNLMSLASAKAELDFIVDHEGVHRAADRLLETAGDYAQLASSKVPPTDKSMEAALEALKSSRIAFERELCAVLPLAVV